MALTREQFKGMDATCWEDAADLDCGAQVEEYQARNVIVCAVQLLMLCPLVALLGLSIAALVILYGRTRNMPATLKGKNHL